MYQMYHMSKVFRRNIHSIGFYVITRAQTGQQNLVTCDLSWYYLLLIHRGNMYSYQQFNSVPAKTCIPQTGAG